MLIEAKPGEPMDEFIDRVKQHIDGHATYDALRSAVEDRLAYLEKSAGKIEAAESVVDEMSRIFADYFPCESRGLSEPFEPVVLTKDDVDEARADLCVLEWVVLEAYAKRREKSLADAQ